MAKARGDFSQVTERDSGVANEDIAHEEMMPDEMKNRGDNRVAVI